MDFSSLVLIERDKENKFIRELDSYNVSEGAIYITKLYYDGQVVHLQFDTNKDVEEWEYSAIFDLFDLEAFSSKDYEVIENEDEYNPTWEITFEYTDNYKVMEEKLNSLCEMIKEAMEKVFFDIQGKEDEYK
ncbi:DUF6762 family protein [Clostridium cellulovorans]|uniref:Uncharacterized protein n=1 Tax=Clostridium cellulovorans (strain ATCC 35296 / DSM 3052 / OCM 3 / 743B) TaxID=573061 RepID=D9SSV0_CLOC7|nr:DUF6762 family protein [Clostridium cellulovorans]ADL52612.1 hypothetical protein Clocel_2918 [Clostridium cellulovorans 743B]